MSVQSGGDHGHLEGTCCLLPHGVKSLREKAGLLGSGVGLQLCLPVWYTGPVRAAPSWGCHEVKGGPVQGPELHLAGGEDSVGVSPPHPAHHGVYLCPLSASLSFPHRNLGVFHIRKDGVG